MTLRMDNRELFVSFLYMVVCILTAVPVQAQSNGNGDKVPSPPIEISRSAIQERISSLNEQGSLDESTRTEIEKIYQQALDELATVEELKTRISEYETIQKNGSDEIKKFEEQLEELTSAPDLEVPDEAPIEKLLNELEKTGTYIPAEPELSFLQQELNDRQSELSNVQSNLEEITQKLDESKSRRENIQQLLNEAQDELETVTTELKAVNLSDSPNEKVVANLVLLHARKKKLESRIEALNLEKNTYDLRRELLQTKQAFLKTRKNRLDKIVQLWQMIVSRNMERKAEEELEETKETLSNVKNTFPFIEDLAQKVTDLAEERTSQDGPIQGLKRITERLKGTRSIRQSVVADLSNVKERIRAAGLTHQLGSLLRRKKDELPSINDHRGDISELEQKLSDAQLRLIELNEDRSNLIQEQDQIISSHLNKLGNDVSDEKRRELRSKLTDLINRRLGLIEKLIEEYDRYFTKLTDLIAEKRKLVQVLQDYRTYIDERVIWIRSTANFFNVYRPEVKPDTKPVTSDCRTPANVDASIREVPEALQCLFQFQHLKKVSSALIKDISESYFIYTLIVLLLFALLWYRPRYFRYLSEAAQDTFSRYGDSFVKTGNAMLYTALLAIPVPGILLFFGWRLSLVPAPDGGIIDATCISFLGTGMYYLTLAVLRHTCHPDGLGRNHFRWTADNIQKIRTNILYFLYPTVPLVFLFVLTNHLENRFYRDTLGRLFFIIAMLLVTWFIQRVLTPDDGILSNYLKQRSGGWIDRLRYVWYPIVVCIPLALGVLAVFGYYYTARQLMYRLSLSVVVFLGLLYLVEIFVRWQVYKNIEYAVQKREERQKDPDDDEYTSGDGTQEDLKPKEETFSLPSVNEQTQQLLWSFFWIGLAVGLWLIWADVLPALGMLDEVELWSHPEQVLETVSGAEGQTVQRSVERQMPVTLADVLLGLIIIVMTVIVSKNLPGLLEITLLHYLPMDQGLRYAYKTISRYMIVLIGITGATAMFGIRWGDIQWLLAGVSVGLGFGLQEIFANFVSGIILLFERPIRVGDTITVNEVTGKVTRIRTRATTIEDLDRKELVVPNRDFIQGELVNWTLSDSIMRVVIPIGVAYGSDTDLVEQKLREITRNEDIVLQDPAPTVIFKGFGDSALDFSLRFFIEDYDNYWKAFHRINRAVDKKFKEAGITIAFPQRDLHLKSVNDDISVSFAPEDIPADTGDTPEEPEDGNSEKDNE